MKFRNEGLIRSLKPMADYASSEDKPADGWEPIDCGLGHSPFGCPPEIKAVMDKIDLKDLVEYPGDPFAKGLSAKVRERYGLSDNTEVFLGGAGSYGLLASIFSDLVDFGYRSSADGGIVGFGPQFTNVAMLANRAGIDYFPVEPRLQLGADQKCAVLCEWLEGQNSGRKIVYLDNPNNPTGDYTSPESLVELLGLTQRRGDLLIIDEAYGDSISDPGSAFGQVENYENVICLRSISKTVGLASPRLGYAVMSKDLARAYKKIELVFNVDKVTQLIGSMALDINIIGDFLEVVRKRTTEAKGKFIEMLRDHEIAVFPTNDAVSIMLAQGEQTFYQDLLSVGILTEAGSSFKYTHQQMNDSFVRFRVPTPDKIDQVSSRLSIIPKR